MMWFHSTFRESGCRSGSAAVGRPFGPRQLDPTSLQGRAKPRSHSAPCGSNPLRRANPTRFRVQTKPKTAAWRKRTAGERWGRSGPLARPGRCGDCARNSAVGQPFVIVLAWPSAFLGVSVRSGTAPAQSGCG